MRDYGLSSIYLFSKTTYPFYLLLLFLLCFVMEKNICSILFVLSPFFDSIHLATLMYFNNEQSKNTCAHNNTQKEHANGIKKAKRTKHVSTRGMDPKFLRNQKFAKKYNGSKRVHDE